MADNVELNQSSGGANVATDEVGGAHHQRVKVEFGGDGTATEVTASAPLPVAQASAGTIRTMFVRMLDTDGDGSGTTDAIGDYSGTNDTEFKFAPGAGEVARVHRMLVHVEDGGSFDSGAYGNNVSLTNGIEVGVSDGTSTLIDLTDGHPVTTNADVNVMSFGAGNEHMAVRWTFAKSGQPIRLDGDNGEYLYVKLNDDYTDLVHHHFNVQGYWE